MNGKRKAHGRDSVNAHKLQDTFQGTLRGTLASLVSCWAAWRAEEAGLGEELLSVNEFSGTAEDASLKFLHSLKTNVTTEQLRSVSEALFGSNGTASLAASGNLPGTSASGPKPHAQGAVGVTNPGRAEQLPCQTQLGVEAAVGAAGAGAIGAAGAAADGAGKDDVLSVQDLRDIAKK